MIMEDNSPGACDRLAQASKPGFKAGQAKSANGKPLPRLERAKENLIGPKASKVQLAS
jgi:hypothetical protein